MSDDTAKALANLLTLVMAVWVVTPQHTRQLLRMRAAALAKRAAGEAARRAGAVSMGAELDSGRQLYAVPYALSRARDFLGRLYDQAREV